MFSRKVRRIITLCLVAVVIISLALYYIPWVSRFSLDLNAAKLDKNGNIIGNTTISISGKLENYLFRKDSLSAMFEPFDGLNWVELTENTNLNRTGILYNYSKDCLIVNCYTAYGSCDLIFTKDFKYVVLFRQDNMESNTSCYYVASADASVPIEEVINFFRYAPPLG